VKYELSGAHYANSCRLFFSDADNAHIPRYCSKAVAQVLQSARARLQALQQLFIRLPENQSSYVRNNISEGCFVAPSVRCAQKDNAFCVLIYLCKIWRSAMRGTCRRVNESLILASVATSTLRHREGMPYAPALSQVHQENAQQRQWLETTSD
jgi:hypothetical protein